MNVRALRIIQIQIAAAAASTSAAVQQSVLPSLQNSKSITTHNDTLHRNQQMKCSSNIGCNRVVMHSLSHI